MRGWQREGKCCKLSGRRRNERKAFNMLMVSSALMAYLAQYPWMGCLLASRSSCLHNKQTAVRLNSFYTFLGRILTVSAVSVQLTVIYFAVLCFLGDGVGARWGNQEVLSEQRQNGGNLYYPPSLRFKASGQPCVAYSEAIPFSPGFVAGSLWVSGEVSAQAGSFRPFNQRLVFLAEKKKKNSTKKLKGNMHDWAYGGIRTPFKSLSLKLFSAWLSY